MFYLWFEMTRRGNVVGTNPIGYTWSELWIDVRRMSVQLPSESKSHLEIVQTSRLLMGKHACNRHHTTFLFYGPRRRPERCSSESWTTLCEKKFGARQMIALCCYGWLDKTDKTRQDDDLSEMEPFIQWDDCAPMKADRWGWCTFQLPFTLL